jgi:hypothetical protein
VVVGIAVSLTRPAGAAWRRFLWIVSGLGVLVCVLMTHPGLILDLPHPYTLLQFSYRLETYVLLALCAAVLATLVLMRCWPQRWRTGAWTGMALVLLASAVGAVQQVDSYPKGDKHPIIVVPDRNVIFAPNNQPPVTAGGLGDYDDASLPLVNPVGVPEVVFPSSAIRDSRVSAPIDLSAGELIHTNITGAPYLVNFEGARVVGRDPNGHIVLQAEAVRRGAPQRISLAPSKRLPVVLGRAISLLALVFLGISLIAVLAVRLRNRHQHRTRACGRRTLHVGSFL